MLSDTIMKLLSISGLLVYAGAAALMFTGRLGHWPLTIALLLITLSAVVVMYLDGLPWHDNNYIALAVCLGSVSAAVWQMAAASKWSMAAVILVICVQGLTLLVLVLFLQFFRMDRLW